jgi:diguanylate cyclase (GGDEF)-like protein
MNHLSRELIKDEKIALRNKWRRAHHKVMICISGGVFLFEIVMFFFVNHMGFIYGTVGGYFRKYVIEPGLCYVVLNSVVSFLLARKSIPESAKNYIMSLGFGILFICVFFFHDFFVAVLAGCMFAVIFTSIYSDVLLTYITTATVSLLAAIIGFYGRWDSTTLKNSLYDTNVVIMISFIVASSAAATVVIRWEENRLRQFTKKQHEVSRLKEQVTLDPLTGVNNRRALRSYIDEEKRDVTFVMIDVDHFKKINDKWGHAIGDTVLLSLGKILLSQRIGSYIPFRYGGDEFLLAFTDETESAVVEMCDKLQRQFINFISQDMKKESICLSIGIALYRKGESPHEAIMRADEALYQIKTNKQDKIKVMY